ncbi:hypothetical protein BB560_003941 [Smittium megazygosporum]|uniref:Enoyl reductase (ER) domain-containing protein n=1 Tax=Smittium megazygosporum TaxID=133381 RepID=A0A2T9ZAM5_9FUNG|nr:hypothetical protein BB560_003941 [Smittium megazygosporum]
MTAMKALVYDKYGGIEKLHFDEVQVPEPKKGEILTRVHATCINAGDLILLKGEPWVVRPLYGIFGPKYKILGHDFSGIVSKLGEDVSEFKVGDAVYGFVPNFWNGAFTEYVCIPATSVVKKPENMSFEEAAAFPTAAITALQPIRDYRTPPNPTPGRGSDSTGTKEKAMIYGASGGVGSYAIQIAKAFGYEVTAVCSTRNVDQARLLGADIVIDYKQQSPFKDPKREYALVFACNGDNSICSYTSLLKDGGVFANSGGSSSQTFSAIFKGATFSRGKVFSHMLKLEKKDLEQISELFQAKKLDANIDKIFLKDQLIDAMKYFSEGKAKGKVVIKMVD